MMLSYVQTCRICGLKQSASYEHESDCFVACDSNAVKMRSIEEIKNKIKSLDNWSNRDETIMIDALKWVLGEDTI